MSTPKHPVGRQPAAVYRRRRLTVLLVLLAIIAVIVLLILQPWSGRGASARGAAPVASLSHAPRPSSPTPSAAPTTLPGPTSSPNNPTAAPKPTSKSKSKSKPKPSGTPAAKASADGQPCTTADVDVEAITDAASYRSGQQPLLSLSLTNTGSSACTMDAGTATMVFTITSGSEQYWTSTDCQSNPVHTDIKLEPGKTLTTTPIPWDRARSSKTTCQSKTRPAAPAGGASYHLAVSVDGFASQTTKQFLLY